MRQVEDPKIRGCFAGHPPELESPTAKQLAAASTPAPQHPSTPIYRDLLINSSGGEDVADVNPRFLSMKQIAGS